MGKLTDMKVRTAKPGIYGDGAGLYLRVKPSGTKSFVLRVVQHGVGRKDVGLGGYPADLTLAEAREKAHRLRKLARQGKDPHAARDKEKAPEVIFPTFAEAVDLAHAELSKGWGGKHGDAFKASLKEHAVPRLGTKRVDQITTSDVIAALSPIWTTKPSIASKVRVRIMQVLSFARSKGWRTAPLPEARELRDGLARQPKGKNFAAMPWKDVPAFFADQLGKEETAGRLALLFTIATAARSGEVRSARWEHIDLEARTWTRPGELMKSGVRHVVTLNDAAISILERAKALAGDSGLIFPGTKGQLSDMTISKVMRTAGRAETVHGFRSSFRDWAAERMPTIPAMVAEMALAHSVGNKTEQAYLRSDLRDQRRALMDAWGLFIAASLSGSGTNVVRMERA
ncbi:tyrosine-type recombinase/integrase [Sphingobium abikonense]|uniref:tyrosine-type recombinase/integrase n=1 Tax=Sphingobium abikonense TaxID=86193 RepID=UPI0035140BFD